MAEAATNTTVFDELIQDWGNFGPLPEPELDEESTLGWRPGAGVGYQAMADRVWKMMQVTCFARLQAALLENEVMTCR
eukprot:1542753-Rhodomonas_salina.1